MRTITIEELCNLLEVMTIAHSHDHGFAIAHFGHIEGQPTIAISNMNGTGAIIQ